MEHISQRLADLVAERQKREISLETLAELSGASIETLQAVERHGVRASVQAMCEYAHALGYEASLALHAEEELSRRTYATCEACGEVAKYHKQHHSVLLGCCVDEGVADLWLALVGLGIQVTGACEGWSDNRRGGEAHLTFPTIADARAFYALVDRSPGELPWRAGLRAGRRSGAWTSSVAWEMLPGDLLADARVIVRFPSSDVRPLAELAKRPPRSPMTELAMKRVDRED